jgi:hypothetical protein
MVFKIIVIFEGLASASDGNSQQIEDVVLIQMT